MNVKTGLIAAVSVVGALGLTAACGAGSASEGEAGGATIDLVAYFTPDRLHRARGTVPRDR